VTEPPDERELREPWYVRLLFVIMFFLGVRPRSLRHPPPPKGESADAERRGDDEHDDLDR
jgi:hypothetical protein